MEEQKEAHILGSPDFVDIASTRKILHQMSNCICQLKVGNLLGTGFFCKIPDANKKTMNCLLTANHVLNEENYDKTNKIIVSLNDNEIDKTIDLGIARRVYFNEERDVDLTIIELDKADEIENFLELEEEKILYKEKDASNNHYKSRSIYIPQYPNHKKASVSYGVIKNKDNLEIYHTCNTDHGSSGSPILDLESLKVIGIHTSSIKKTKETLNIGTFLNFLLNIEFKTKQNKYSVNEIKVEKKYHHLIIMKEVGFIFLMK